MNVVQGNTVNGLNVTSNREKSTNVRVNKMNTVSKWLMWLTAVAMLAAAMALTAVAHADEPAPVVLEGQTQDVVAPASAAFPRFYLSAPGMGNVAGNGYADEDIMLYNSGNNSWSKAFDGTNKGLADSADIDALAVIINSGYVSFLMSFEAPAAVPGLGVVDDSDVVQFDTFNDNWSLYLDGSTVGLSTNGEDVDALTFSPGGFLVVSTSGGYAVLNIQGGSLKGNDKDLILLADGKWTRWMRGTDLGMASSNDVRGASFVRFGEPVIEDGRYIVGAQGFTLPNGVQIGASDVAEQLWFQNGATEHYKRLDASDINFPNIDAIEVVK